MWGPVVQYTDLSGTAQSSCYDCSDAPQQDSARTGADSAQWSMAPAEDQTRHPQASELSYSAPPLRVTLLTVDMVGFCLFVWTTEGGALNLNLCNLPCELKCTNKSITVFFRRCHCLVPCRQDEQKLTPMTVKLNSRAHINVPTACRAPEGSCSYPLMAE